MLLKITLVITVITTCFGAPPLHQQTKSNQATYSQSFVRKDVPISYQYRATHDYTSKKQEDNPKQHEDTLKWHENIPKKHKASYEPITVKTHNDPPFKSLSNQTFQLTPLFLNSRENTYPTTPVLYTSIVYEPVNRSGQLELTENPAKSALHLEPKHIHSAEQNVGPTTYRTHLNHDIKMYHSHHAHLRPKFNEIPTPKFEMAGVHNLAVYHQLQRQREQLPKHFISTTTENPKMSHRVNLGVRILPKQESPFVTIPHELNRNAPFLPIPRLAYNNKLSGKLGVQQTPIRNNHIHLNTFHSGVLNTNH